MSGRVSSRVRLMVVVAAVTAALVPSVMSPAVAADDGRIIFSAGGETFQLDMSGSGVTAKFEVPPIPVFRTNALMSPDGSRVAYVLFGEVDDEFNKIEDDRLFIMDADGSDLVEVAAGSGVAVPGDLVSLRLNSWSPDSSAVAYTESVERPFGGGGSTVIEQDVFRVDADGSDAKNLTNTGAASDGMWSPTGSKIAFISDSMGIGTPKVSLMDPDGTNATPITDGSIRPVVVGLRWFPDGSKIAFVGWSGLDETDVFWVASSGGPVTQVTDGPQGRQTMPFASFRAWTPTNGTSTIAQDGSHMTIHSADLSDFTSGVAYVVSTDGSTATELAVGPGEYALSEPIVYSPDGSRIAYMGRSSGSPAPSTIYVANADGSDPTPVATGNLDDWIPGSVPLGDAVAGLVDPSQGFWHLYDDAGALVSQFFYGNPGDFPIVGDWDCDGVETPGMYRQSDGYVYLRNSNTQGAADVRFFFGDPGDVPIAGDFNGNGCDTVSIYRPVNQTFYIINELGEDDGGLGAAEFSYVFGDPGDKPFVGDFNGNGTETVGLHRESTGLVYFRNSHTQGNADAQFIFGDPGDRLVAGDWNGDGKYSPALYRPGNTTMYFRYTNTQGNADNQFIPTPNGADWLPVAGDFE